MVMTDDARPAPGSTSGRQLRELTPTAMWTTAVVITILTAGAVIALWWPATAGLVGADLVKARLDALKIGLSIGVGSGGVVALYLAWRRQHSTEADLDNRERTLAHQQDVAATTQAHQERVADDARADAAARRITELYLKAAELLGSEKAPVRLSGLYALERLAQDNESQRQTIVNVLCAYLRMPYDLPAEKDREEGASAEQRELYRERSQEREVRLTAQRLLNDHLDPARGTAYWGELDLDLTGAQLINFTLTHTRIGTSVFRQATFTGDAWFNGATFSGVAGFGEATFTGGAGFEGAIFTDDAEFGEATFTGRAGFDAATFTGGAWFGGAIVTGAALFGKATFSSVTEFSEVTFTGAALFGGATFRDDAEFGKATFTDNAWFEGATFIGDAEFDEATFCGDAEFGDATFNGGVRFDGATLDSEPFQPTFVSGDSDDSGQPG